MTAYLELFAVVFIVVVAVGFVGANMLVGSLVRRRVPEAAKAEAYECGEPALGHDSPRFDVRYMVAGIVFLLLDVELVLLLPWATVYGQAGAAAPALVDFAVFTAFVMGGYAFLWRHGHLDGP